MKNIVLIGMPGSGKSCIAAELKKLYNKVVKDSDEEIYIATGRTPSEIINEDGEAAFRDTEANVIKNLSSEDGIVIATGGGAVLFPKNVEALKTNGIIVWIKRDIDKLATDGRPLSCAGRLDKLYEERKSFYEAAADFDIENDDTPAIVARRIYNAVKDLFVV